jgi:hypothetical protein
MSVICRIYNRKLAILKAKSTSYCVDILIYKYILLGNVAMQGNMYSPERTLQGKLSNKEERGTT